MSNFPILIETEENAVGSVLRLLHKTPGIVGIHLQLDEAARAAAAGVKQLTPPKQSLTRNHPLTHGRGSGISKTIGAALAKAPLHWKILKEIVKRSGFSENSTRQAITRMVINKEIQRIASGTYRLTVRGDQKYIQGKLPPRRSPKGIGMRPLILGEVQKRGGSIEHVELKNHLMDHGFADANMYNMVPKMQKERLLVRNGNVYSITKQGGEFLSSLNERSAAEEKALQTIENKTMEKVD